MDEILRQLGGILLRSIPTFILVVLLNFYLKSVFFKPLEKTLHKRYEATDGARKLAEEALERATAKTAQYEAALRAARTEVYQQQEQLHKQLQEKEAAQLAEARKRADDAVKAARAQIAADVAAARATLEQDADRLAAEIADSILRRSAA